MIKFVDHVNIVVSDLERSVFFYTQILGLRETRRAHLEGEWIETIMGLKGVVADVVYVQPPGGGPRVELLHFRSPEGAVLPQAALPNTQGLRHLAFQVEDVDEASRKLLEVGIKLLSAPCSIPGRTIRHPAGSKRLCYFRDPDGVLLEIAEYRTEVDGQ